MATPFTRRARRSDSGAAAIAAKLRQRDAGLPSVARIRAPFGTTVGHYLLPGTQPGRGPVVAVTAAAEVIFGGATVGQKVKRAGVQSWQDESWELRREIGEFRFSGDRVARAVSQCRLFIAKLPDAMDAQPEPVTEGPVYELGRQMFGNRALVQQELKRAGQHLGFNGESLLLIRQDPDTQALSWGAHSVREITGQGDSLKLDDGVNQTPLVEGPDMVVRCWSPDPQRGGLADCPAQSVLPVARELKGLTEHTSAQIDSRLAGAGMLVMPDTVEVLAGQSSSVEEGDEDAEMDGFVRALVESMTVPLGKRDSAAAIVPLVIKVPESAIDKIQHITFSSPFDAMAKDMREEAIRRVALGMDSDPSVLLGLGGGNHWSAWLVSEEEVSLVVSPLAATICHAFTVGFLRPILDQVAPGEDPNNYMVWFDPSELELRPDKSADARTLRETGLLSDAVTLTANGFDPKSDAPSPDEYRNRLLEKLVLVKPDLAEVILPLLGINLVIPAAMPAAEPAPALVPAGAPPPENDGQDRELPPTIGDPPPSAGPVAGPSV